MTYQITYTKRFEKHLKASSKTEKNQIRKKVEMLAENPFHPSLRTKRIQGTDDLFECSVNMDILNISKDKGKIYDRYIKVKQEI